MKPAVLASLLIAAIAPAAAACAQTAPVDPPSAVPTTEPAPPANPDAIIGQKPVLPLRAAKEFICSDGQLVSLEVDETAGILRGVRGGEVFTLQQQIGYTPARFVTGSDTVVLDGDVAKLRRGRTLAEQTCNRLPPAPVAGTLWGTVTKLDRMALPAGTVVKVLLVDGARMDAPAVELGSTRIVTTGNQVPLWFLLTHDPARTAHPASPLLQARIETAKGQLLYITDTANPIPGDGPAPSPIELKLVSTSSR